MSLKNPFQAPGVVTQNIAGPLAPGQDPSSNDQANSREQSFLQIDSQQWAVLIMLYRKTI